MAAEAQNPNKELVETLRVGEFLRLQALNTKLDALFEPSSTTEKGRIDYLLMQVPELAPVADQLRTYFSGSPVFGVRSWTDIKNKAAELYDAWQKGKTEQVRRAGLIELKPDMKEAVAVFRDIKAEDLARAQKAAGVETYLAQKFRTQPQQQAREPERQEQGREYGRDQPERPANPANLRPDLKTGIDSLRVRNAQGLISLLSTLNAPLNDPNVQKALEDGFNGRTVRAAVETATQGFSLKDGREIADIVYKYYVQGVLYSMEDSLQYRNMLLRSLDELRTDWDRKLPRV